MDKKSGLGVMENEAAPVNPGERTCVSGKAVANSILLALPNRDFDLIRPHLEFVVLAHHSVLYESNRKLECAYFVNSGMVSLVFTTRDGDSVEVGVVGSEGFTPLALAGGINRSPHRAVVQISGAAFKLNAADFENVVESSLSFRKLLSRYAALHGIQVAQTAGCNRLHNLEQRLARWLLLTQDRVESGLLRITHDFLATMLGTDRPSVSLAAGSLQRKHIIEYTHGAVKILNRKKLESSACECYGITQQFNGELGLK